MGKVAFTAGRVNGFKCPADKKQAFLWDATAPGLGLRVTPNGKPAYVFQTVFEGKDLRITIGSPTAWSIKDAQEKARELQRQVDEGKDPREVKREREAEREAKRQQTQAEATTVGEAWTAYLVERRPHWGKRHYDDHLKMAKAGGEPAKSGPRRGKPTEPGPVHELLAQRLADLDTLRIEAWAAKHGKTRPTYARLCWRCLKAFLAWCAEHETFKAVTPAVNPAVSRKARESLGKPGVKSDALLREQLPAWFDAVRSINNPTIAAALQVMLLTGARPGEVLTLRWDDVNTQWLGLTIRDKVEGERTIPLTPYVQHLLNALPRRNEWVFTTGRTASMSAIAIKRRTQRAKDGAEPADVTNVGKAGHIAPPTRQHTDACRVAGISDLTLHGLRRSFRSLTEWLDIPAGVVAQIMGHKPSATAEKHYTVRPLDLLRVHHERIEAWILAQAGVPFDAKAEPGKLRVAA